MEIDFARISRNRRNCLVNSLVKYFLKSSNIDKIRRTNDVSSYRFDTCVRACVSERGRACEQAAHALYSHARLAVVARPTYGLPRDWLCRHRTMVPSRLVINTSPNQPLPAAATCMRVCLRAGIKMNHMHAAYAH